MLGAIVRAIFAAGGTAAGVSRGSHPKAALAVLSEFLLLAVGVVLSWHKSRLLGVANPRPSDLTNET